MKKQYSLLTIAMIMTVVGTPTVADPIVYSQDFTVTPDRVAAFQQQIGTGALVTGHTALGFGQFAVQDASNYTVDTGVLHMDSDTAGSTPRVRSASVWIDTSSLSPGAYTASFDVTSFTANTGTARFDVFEGSGLNAGYVTIRTGQNNGTGAYPYDGDTPNGAPATFTHLSGAGTPITGVSSISYDFTLNEAGAAGDYVALSWTQYRSTGTSFAPVFDVDNIVLTAIPEPSSLILLGAGLIMMFSVLRRKRS